MCTKAWNKQMEGSSVWNYKKIINMQINMRIS